MGWVVGGQFHVRSYGEVDDRDWPTRTPDNAMVEMLTTDRVVDILCAPDVEITIVILTGSDVNFAAEDFLGAINLATLEGRFCVGTVDFEHVVALDGRPTSIHLNILANRARDSFTIGLPEGLSGRLVLAPDDVADDLIDIPTPPDIPAGLVQRRPRHGFPLLVTILNQRTGETRLVSARVFHDRYPGVEWRRTGAVDASELAVKMSRSWAASEQNIARR